MSVWAAAYDLPHLVDPGKKIAFIPILDYRVGRHADAFREEGAIKVPVGFNRLDELFLVDPDDHANDVGSVIHVFQRDVLGSDDRPIPVASFVAERRPDDLKSRATSTTDISGRGLTAYFLDRIKLAAFDAPSDPTYQGDWAFGGPNLLGNPGFEESTASSTVYELTIEATSGTYTLTDGTDTTDPIAFDAVADTIANQIEADLAFFVDVVVAPAGLSPRKFIITYVDPPYGVFLTVNGGSLTPVNSATLVRTTTGELSPSPWTVAKTLGSAGGFYTTFTVTDVRSHTGLYSLEVNPGPSTATSNRWPGAQQIVSVTPGIAQASIWVYPTSASDTFQLQIRGIGEEVIAYSPSTTLTVNNWNLIEIPDVVIPIGTTQIIFRLYCTNPGPSDPAPFFVDDGLFYMGLPPANLGTIWGLILAASPSFLVPTFTDTLDSNGVPWDTERSVTLSEGDSWGQIAEAFQRLWGYVHRVRFDREDNLYYFDIFNPGYIAFDHSTTDTGSLIVGMNILEGETISRGPDGTSWHVKGEGGIWVEDTDAVLEAAWGEAQVFIEANTVGNVDDLQAILDQAKLTTADQMISFETGMNNQSQFSPFVHFDIFHLISVNLGGRSSIPRGDRIVTSIVMSGKPGQAPHYGVFVNSDAFASTGAAALAEAVRRLLRKRGKPIEEAGGPLTIGDKGGHFTIQIVASNANPISFPKADRECTGVDDYGVIMDAINEITVVGGEVHLSDGTFNTGSVKIIVPSTVTLTGRGRSTIINATVDDDWAVEGREGAILRGFNVINPNGHGARLASPC